MPVGAALVSEEVADTISLRRSRQHLRRQPARLPGGAVRPRRAGRRRAARRTSSASAPHFEQRLRAIAAEAPDREGSARRGLMWGLELTRDAAPVVPAGARARRHRQPHGGDGRPAAAAARHHRSRGRRSARPSRCGARRRRSAGMTRDARPHHAAHRRSRREREEAARAHHGEPRGRPPAAADARRADGARRRASSSRCAARTIVGCAELAPLSPQVAEVRSLAVDADARGSRVGDDDRRRAAAARAPRRLREAVRVHARARLLHPHGLLDRAAPWLPEKIFTDCVKCPQFRTCGQYAMVVPLDSAFDADRMLTTCRRANAAPLA